MEIRKKVGFILGPLLFFLIYFAPILSENPRAHDLLAVFLLVVVWWVTECIPIPVTALLNPIFLTILKITTIKVALTPFANPIIMLFLGSFAFMLPAATPPNAIIYGSGLIKLPQMMKAGFWLNIAGILIIWLSITFLGSLLGLI